MSSDSSQKGPRRWIDPHKAWSRWGRLDDVRVIPVEPHGSRAERAILARTGEEAAQARPGRPLRSPWTASGLPRTRRNG